MFIIDDNNTLQSRSTDTLDQLVSVIECTEATLVNDNSTDSFKKRNFMQIEYIKDEFMTKNFKKDKREFKASDTHDDCSSTILDYSTDHLMDKRLHFDNDDDKSRIKHH